MKSKIWKGFIYIIIVVKIFIFNCIDKVKLLSVIKSKIISLFKENPYFLNFFLIAIHY